MQVAQIVLDIVMIYFKVLRFKGKGSRWACRGSDGELNIGAGCRAGSFKVNAGKFKDMYKGKVPSAQLERPAGLDKLLLHCNSLKVI